MLELLNLNRRCLFLASAVMLLPLVISYEKAFWLGVTTMAIAWFAGNLNRQQYARLRQKTGSDIDEGRVSAAIDEYISALKDCVERQVSLCQRELNQLSGVLSDAVSNLSASFHAMHTLTGGHTSQACAVLAQLEQSKSNEALQSSFGMDPEKMDDLIRCFDNYLIQAGNIATRMTNAMNDCSRLVDEVEKLIDFAQIKSSTGQLPGMDSGPAQAGGYDVTAGQAGDLISHSDQCRVEIGARVNAARRTIEGARTTIESASSHDRIVGVALKTALDNMMGDINTLNERVSVETEQAGQLSARLDLMIGNAVRGLQFEDIARQLIDSLCLNLQEVQALSDAVRINLRAFKSDDKATWIKELEQGTIRLTNMRGQWRNRRQQIVSQSSMAAGDVELF